MAFAAVNSSGNRQAFSTVDNASAGVQPWPAVDYSIIDKAFAADASLRRRVYDAISTRFFPIAAERYPS